jgi:hypothetical protein
MDKKEYHKQYYLDNKEKIKERGKKYYYDNKEKCKTVRKKYRDENKEKVRKWVKEWRQNHHLVFLGKQITLDNIERTLLCICCRFQGSTDLHHLKYDLNDPLKYTVELCGSCHALWHHEENYLRFGKKRILPSKELIIENTMNLEEGIGGAGDGL